MKHITWLFFIVLMGCSSVETIKHSAHEITPVSIERKDGSERKAILLTFQLDVTKPDICLTCNKQAGITFNIYKSDAEIASGVGLLYLNQENYLYSIDFDIESDPDVSETISLSSLFLYGGVFNNKGKKYKIDDDFDYVELQFFIPFKKKLTGFYISEKIKITKSELALKYYMEPFKKLSPSDKGKRVFKMLSIRP